MGDDELRAYKAAYHSTSRRLEAAERRIKELETDVETYARLRDEATARIEELKAERDGWFEQVGSEMVLREDAERRIEELEAFDIPDPKPRSDLGQ